MKFSLRTFGLIGFIAFTLMFAVTYSSPAFIESIGKEFIKNKVIEKTENKIETFTQETKDSKFGKLVGKFINSNDVRINKLKSRLNDKLHEEIADVIAEMQNLDCECRKKYANFIEGYFKSSIGSLTSVNQKLTDFMKGKYMEVTNKLKLDFRIFTFSNALVFLFLIIASFRQPKAIKQLFLPGVLLFSSSVISSYFYLFKQNWFLTIMFDSYVGWTYLFYLILVFLILYDIVFNRARVTTFVLENTIGAISNISFSIC